MLSPRQVSVKAYSKDELYLWIKGHAYWQCSSEMVIEPLFILVFVEKCLKLCNLYQKKGALQIRHTGRHKRMLKVRNEQEDFFN